MISGPRSLGNLRSRILPDRNDLLVWKFDENSGDILNTGTAADGDLDVGSGVAQNLSGGLWGLGCVYSPGTATTHRCLGAAGIKPAGSNLTVSGWYKRVNTTAGLDFLVSKHYDSDGTTWSTPFYAWTIRYSAGLSAPNVSVRVSGSFVGGVNLGDTAVATTPYEWHHVGFTHDGTTLKCYFDGKLMSSQECGAIDYGSDGPYRFNGQPVTAGEHVPGVYFCDWRIADVVRPEAWFLSVWNSR